MRHIRTFIIFILLAIPFILFADDNTSSLDPKENVIGIAKEKILEFDTYLQELCSKDKVGDKPNVKEKILNLFIARGNVYSSIDGMDMNPACAVIVSNRAAKRMPIKRFLGMLPTISQSKRFQITDCEVYILEEIKKLQDNKCSCTAYVTTVHRLLDPRPGYPDITTRKLIIDLLTNIEVKDGLVLLGDIYFNDIAKL